MEETLGTTCKQLEAKQVDLSNLVLEHIQLKSYVGSLQQELQEAASQNDALSQGSAQLQAELRALEAAVSKLVCLLPCCLDPCSIVDGEDSVFF